MKRMSLFNSVGLMILVLALCGTSNAAVPSVLHYQGVLTDGGGTPVTTNTSVIFTLYSAPIGGVIRWTEPRNVTPDSEGRFSILLGQAVPLHDTVFKMPPLFLGVQAGAEPEMTPRSLLSSSAFAFRISTVDGAAGGNVIGGVEVLTGGSGDGLGVRDPGGNVASMTSTSAAFSDVNDDTITQIGTAGLYFTEPSTGDTIFSYDPLTSAMEMGLGNLVTGNQSFAIGTTNTVHFDNSFAVGTDNLVEANNGFAVGTGNIAQGENSIVSGSQNQSLGLYSSVLGGFGNVASASYSTVAGGEGNVASQSKAFVGGGTGNVASATGSVILGGFGNQSQGTLATVVGGTNNLTEQQNSFVGGGASNKSVGSFSAVVGGHSNYAGEYSFVGGGFGDTASEYASVVAGGQSNLASGRFCFSAGRRAKAIHTGAFVWGDSTFSDVSSSANNQWTVRATGGVRFYTNTSLTTGAVLTPGSGSWASVSDRSAKENVEPVSGDDILEKLGQIPIAKWNYTSQDDSIRHIGPMAQDFYAAFGLGEDDKHITTIDADGVLMAAVQALNTRNRMLEEESVSMRRLIESLQVQVNELTKSKPKAE